MATHPHDLARAFLEGAQHFLSGGPVMPNGNVFRPPPMLHPPSGQPQPTQPQAQPQGAPPVPGMPGAPGVSVAPNGTGFQGQTYNPNVPLGVQSSFQANAPLSNQDFSSPYTSMLWSQANGKGPNMGAMELQQATDANIKNAMAMGQSMPGAGSNPMAMQRNILENQASAQQTAAGQAAELDAQQQLGAERLGSGLNVDISRLNLQQGQGNQQAIEQANQLNQSTANFNAGLAATQGQNLQNAAAGGITALGGAVANGLGGTNTPATATPTGGGGYSTAPTALPDTTTAGGGDVSPAIGMAFMGGRIPQHYDDGGPVELDPTMQSGGGGGSSSWLGQPGVAAASLAPLALSLPGGPLAPKGSSSGSPGLNAGLNTAQAGLSAIPLVGPALSAIYGGVRTAAPNGIAGQGTMTTDPSTGQKTIHNPSNIFDISSWKAGGAVPGTPKVNHDAPENDDVPAMLTPKEIVLPLHVTQADDPAEAAKLFVQGIMKGKGPKPGKAEAGFLSALVKRHQEQKTG